MLSIPFYETTGFVTSQNVQPSIIRGQQQNCDKIFQMWAIMQVSVLTQPVILIIISLLLLLSAYKHILRQQELQNPVVKKKQITLS